MKAILEFTLPEEQAEYDLACRASLVMGALEDFTQRLRVKKKYGDLSAEQSTMLENVWADLHHAFEGTGVEL